MKRQNWKPKPNSLICSKHFENGYLDTSKSSCTKLGPGAVPTIFEQVSESEELLSPPKKRVKTMVPVLHDIQNSQEGSNEKTSVLKEIQNMQVKENLPGPSNVAALKLQVVEKEVESLKKKIVIENKQLKALRQQRIRLRRKETKFMR